MILKSSNIARALRQKQRGFLLNPFRFGAGTPEESDPYWDSVVLLMGFEGTIVDEAKGRTFTVNSGAAASTVAPLIGTGSLLLDGVDDYIYTADSNDLDLPADFTIECFIKTGSGLIQTLISKGEGGSGPYSYSVGLTAAGLMRATYGSVSAVTTENVNYVAMLGTTSFNEGSRHHLAWTRQGSTFKIFGNGVEEQSKEFAPALYNNTVALHIGCRIGQGVRQQFFNGRIDEVRITKGVARYNATFTPPSTFFPRS